MGGATRRINRDKAHLLDVGSREAPGKIKSRECLNPKGVEEKSRGRIERRRRKKRKRRKRKKLTKNKEEKW